MNGQEPQQVAEEQKAGTPDNRGPNVQVVFVTSLGFGIRTTLAEFRKAHRGTKGTKAMTLTDKNGTLVTAKVVNENDDISIVTKMGQTGIFPVSEIRWGHRGPSGTKLISLVEGDEVVAII